MEPSEEIQCEVDDVYAYAYSEDPAIGTLSPTLCSHLASFRVTVRARRAGGDANAPPREYFVCTTHRAILDALDRTVRADGGVPRLVSTQALDFGEG